MMAAISVQPQTNNIACNLSVPEAARYTGLSESFLNRMRSTGGGPNFYSLAPAPFTRPWTSTSGSPHGAASRPAIAVKPFNGDGRTKREHDHSCLPQEAELPQTVAEGGF
jgi:hypothetical protein